MLGSDNTPLNGYCRIFYGVGDDKLRQLGPTNPIGPSDLKSDDKIGFRLNDNLDSDYDIRFQLSTDSIKIDLFF